MNPRSRISRISFRCWYVDLVAGMTPWIVFNVSHKSNVSYQKRINTGKDPGIEKVHFRASEVSSGNSDASRATLHWANQVERLVVNPARSGSASSALIGI